jgi:hypothetical protein
MAPSNPVHEKHSFVRGAIEFEDDLFDQRVDFISLAIFDTGVLALECCLSNLTSDAVYGLRAGFFALTLAKIQSS